MSGQIDGPDRTEQFSPELRLLCASARRRLKPVDVERIVDLCRESLDWRLFLRLVFRHRVAPLVWQSLESTGDASIPDYVLSDLHRWSRQNAFTALRQGAELVRIMRSFDDAGIRALPLKGPPLALQAYGSLKLRHAGDDLDLLVDPASVWDAQRLLESAGYSRTDPEYSLSPGQAAAFMKVRKDFTFKHPESPIEVELHWRWSQNAMLLPLTFEEVWSGREIVTSGSQTLPAMSRRELLLYLCAHGAHTGWFRLKWLCDVAELLNGDPPIEMTSVFARAEELGLTRMLVQTLVLAHQVLGAPLPDELDPQISEYRIVQSLIEMGFQALVLDARYWSTDDTPVSWMPTQLRYRLKLRRNLRYKWHNAYFFSLWTRDCARFRLPEKLYPLYYLLAPVLWGTSMVRRSLTSPRRP